MAPRNLTWEEIIDDKLKEISKKRLELRIHCAKDKDLRRQQEFLRDLRHQFIDKMEQIKERNTLNHLNTTPEINEIQQKVERLKLKIDEFSIKIQHSSVKEAEICEELYYLKQELRQMFYRKTPSN